MGKQSDLQSLTLLGLINSSFITLHEARMVPELAATIAYGNDIMTRLINSFPIRWNESEGWWRGVMAKINEQVNSGSEDLYTAHAVTVFGFMMCVDLLEELTDPEKRSIVTEAQEILKAVDNHLDPDGTAFETFEEIDSVLAGVYATVGFTKERRYYRQRAKLQRRLRRQG